MKKACVLFSLLSVSFLQAQVFNSEFVVLKEGAEKDYLAIEEFYQSVNQELVAQGKKLGWSVWKMHRPAGATEMAPHYVIFNVYANEAQRDEKVDYGAIIQKVWKGKMPNSKIKKMQTSWETPRKQTRIYTQKVVDQIPLIGGAFQPGDEIYFNVMTQKNEDYEQYESKVWKPIVAERVINMQHRWWVLSKILDRSEDAYDGFTHVTWNSSIENAPAVELPQDFKSQKLFEAMTASREMGPEQKATLVYSSDR